MYSRLTEFRTKKTVLSSELLSKLNSSIPESKKMAVLKEYMNNVQETLLEGYYYDLPSNAGRLQVVLKREKKFKAPVSVALTRMNKETTLSTVPHRYGHVYAIKHIGGWMERYYDWKASKRKLTRPLSKILRETNKQYILDGY